MDAVTLAAANAAAKKNYKAKRYHNTPSPTLGMPKYGSGRVVCGVDAASGKVWSFNASGLYQVDSLTASNWSAVTLPANTSTTPTEVGCVVWTPPAGVPTLYLLIGNTSNNLTELYSAPVVAKGTAPTWTLRKQFTANAKQIPTAIAGTSRGLYVGEYSGTPTEPAAGCSVYRSTDGATFTTVLGPLTDGTRHIHAIAEDPYAAGTIYISVGDQNAPQYLFKSTDGATFTAATLLSSAANGGNAWQAVSMGFTADWIWCASDQPAGWGPFLLDRATLTPRWATTKNKHDRIPVPGGVGGRILTDAVTTSASATVTSATAGFVSTDVGRGIEGANLLHGSYITAVGSSTSITISQAATGAGTTSPIVLLGDTFYQDAYAGAIDPATGWFYYAANDSSVKGTTAGIFVLTGPDEPPTLFQPIYNTAVGNHRLYIAGGYLFYHVFGGVRTLTAAT